MDVENILECEEGVIIGQYGFLNIHWVYDPFDDQEVLMFDMISGDDDGLHFRNVIFSDYFYGVFRKLVSGQPEEIIQTYYKGINKKVIKAALMKVAEPAFYY